jgi:lipopolysaccharide transport system ATP-binding protein
MKPAIRVDNLSKLYQIGRKQSGSYRTLRESLADAAAVPGRALHRALGKRAAEEADPATDFWALKDISFEVQPGEVVGIIGRNGAGKSTLLKILSRITEPTKGRVEVRGRMSSLLEVGTGFHPELTGRENVYLNGSILGMSRSEIQKKFDEIVAFADIDQFLDTAVKRYSSGMYVRLAFAVAAHLETEILVVDEVLAVGDATFQKRCLGRMAEIARCGRTVLFVSHSLGTVRSLCLKAMWLEKGQVFQQGPTNLVTDRYMQSAAGPSARRINLQGVKPNLGGNAFLFSDVILNKGDLVQHGEGLTVEFHYKAIKEIEEVAVAIGFSDLNGTRLLTIDSDLRGDRRDLARFSKGFIRLVLEEFPLQPGVYNVDIGARSGDNHVLIYFQGCAQIEVLPGPTTPPIIIRNGGGGVRLAPLTEWNTAALT